MSCEVSVSRCIEDFCFPTHCSRGERRHLLTLAKKGSAITLNKYSKVLGEPAQCMKGQCIMVSLLIFCLYKCKNRESHTSKNDLLIGFPALDQLSEELPGKLYSMDELNQETEDRGLLLDAPPITLMKTGVARDWPDARALW